MKKFLRGLLLFVLLMGILSIYLAIIGMLYGFLGWLALMTWNHYLPRLALQRVEILALLMGIIGAICFLVTDSYIRSEIAESLRRAIDFINRLLSKEKGEVKNGNPTSVRIKAPRQLKEELDIMSYLQQCFKQ